MEDLIQALNRLLEAERAGVEALVDLTRMSADVLEREMLQRMGGDEAWACASLRGQIEALGGQSSRQVSPLLAQMRARNHFAERLRLFSSQQRAVLERLNTLLESQQLPEEVRALLTELHRVHVPNIAWCEQRAATFGVQDVQPEHSVSARGTGGRASSESRATAYRGRNRRQTAHESRGGEGDSAEGPRRTRLPDVEGDGAAQTP